VKDVLAMIMTPFVGRDAELDQLEMLLNKKSTSLVVIRGRRRITG